MPKRRRVDGSMIVTCLAPAVFAGCEMSPTALVGGGTEVASVIASAVSVEMTAIGDTAQLSASALEASGEAAGGVIFQWSTSDSSVATVNQAGRVISRNVGSALVTVVAACCGGAADTVVLDVSQTAAQVAVSPTSFQLSAGGNIRLVAFARDRNGHSMREAPFSWESGRPAVATVDANGVVTASGQSEGDAQIRATVGGLTATATGTVTTRPPQGLPSSSTFECLRTAAEVVPVMGHHGEKLSPDAGVNRAFDARGADFVVQAKWGMIDVDGSSSETGMCWAGGYVYSDKPWDASWDDHKDLDGPTRNSAAISNAAYEMTVTGVHYFNVHDGARSSNAYTWLVQHNWGEYVRDDCIENDHMHSGRVYDTLFDGCYTGISTRPSSSDDSSDGAGQLVELDRVLLRMQPMPYPYKWREKSGILGADGQPYEGTGIPYGHGNIFKIENDDIGRNPHFSVRNSVFIVTHYTTAGKLDFPPAALMDACENNTIVWLGPGHYPGNLPTAKFPDCFTVLTGQQGRDYWVEQVSDWHRRHPDVGTHRKPTSPGSLVFPKQF